MDNDINEKTVNVPATYKILADDIVMHIKDFKHACHEGLFTDYDGEAYLCYDYNTLEAGTDFILTPSSAIYDEDKIPRNATHIVWFTKRIL